MGVIDFGAQQAQESFLKKAMAKFGVGYSINEAIASMAGTIRDHKHYARLITETPSELRHAYYELTRPHLKFVAKPLDVYISDVKQEAEREQLPIMQPDGTLKAFQTSNVVTDDQKHAENLMLQALAKRRLTLTCSKCRVEQDFYGMEGDTPVAVIMKARRTGWIYSPVTETETCPECAVPLAN